MKSAALLIKNVRPMGGNATDILIEAGRITRIAPDQQAAPGTVMEDGAGAIVLPGLVEAHTHLDKNLLGLPWHSNCAGPTIPELIENERRLKRQLDMQPERQSARQVVLSIGNGSTHIRSHVDVDTKHGLWGIEGVMATRERYRAEIDIELVVFPQSGMLTRPGTVELMEEALRMGAEVVGGIDPCSMDQDPKGHVDTVFALAQKFGRPVDIHLHEPNELGLFSMGLIVDRTRALGMEGKVTISHAFCLGMNDYVGIGAMLDKLAAHRIALMTTAPAGHPAPPVKRAHAAGVTICSGSDGMRDVWHPWGNADMLDRARIVGMRNGLDKDHEVELALDICTSGGAKVMALADYGLSIGNFGDLVLVEARNVPEAVVLAPPRKLVVKRGRVVARDGKALCSAP
jgi:cytosine/adenosine deaminase-related metal-dependent hydrolase